jgi:hypothetical protein
MECMSEETGFDSRQKQEDSLSRGVETCSAYPASCIMSTEFISWGGDSRSFKLSTYVGLVPLISALVGERWSALRSSRFALHTHWIGGGVDPKVGLDSREKWKFLTLPGLELQPLGSRRIDYTTLPRFHFPSAISRICSYIRVSLLGTKFMTFKALEWEVEICRWREFYSFEI